VPDHPLDLLAQQIVAAVSCEEWKEDDLFALVRRAWPYRDLTRKSFDEVVRMLAEGFSTRRGRRSAHIHRDAVNGRLRGRRGARLTAITSGGAIPENADYAVVLEPSGAVIGTVNEDFASRAWPATSSSSATRRGRSCASRRARSASRTRTASRRPSRSGSARRRALARALGIGLAPAHLDRGDPGILGPRERPAPGARMVRARSPRCGDVRADAPADAADADAAPNPVTEWLTAGVGVAPEASLQIADYLASARAALGVMPSRDTLVIERFFDDSGGMQLVVHSPFGSRINRAFGLALRKRFCVKFNFELQAAATEDAIVISLGHQHSFPLEDVFRYLRSSTVRELLLQALLDAPMFGIRWRWTATRSLAIPRWRSGKKVPAPLQRMEAEDLLAAVFPDQLACLQDKGGAREIPDHPLVNQAIHDCLTEVMDVAGLEELLASIERGEKRLVARDLREPSPLAHEILTARPYAFLDDAPLEERRTQAVQTRRWIDPKAAEDLGTLDAAAIQRVREEAWPLVRDPDELHEALVLLGFLAPDEAPAGGRGWEEWLRVLMDERRATVLRGAGGEGSLWVAAERLDEVRAVFPGAAMDPALELPASLRRDEAPDPVVALAEIWRGRLDSTGPATVSALAALAGLDPATVEAALLRLEGEGFLLRGSFTPGRAETEWCARRLLARIHRYTLERLRREIEPVASADFMRFLFDWQHVSPDAVLEGPQSLSRLVDLLEGYEAPAAAWEGDILPARLTDYDPLWLDALCLSGRLVWARTRLAEPAPAPVEVPTADRRSRGALFDRDRGSGGERDARGRRGAGPVRSTPIRLIGRRHLADWMGVSDRADLAALIAGRAGNGRAAERAGRLLLRRPARLDASAPPPARGRAGRARRAGARDLGRIQRSARASHPLREAAVAGREPAPARRVGVRHGERGRWNLLRAASAESPAERQSKNEAKAPRGSSRRARASRPVGVVFRALMVREGDLPPWRDLLRALRRLEARGEIRGGRFVDGFTGEQFALPEAVAALRAVRRRDAAGALVAVSGADPLNLAGIVTPGERLPSLAGTACSIATASRSRCVSDGRSGSSSSSDQRPPGRRAARSCSAGFLPSSSCTSGARPDRDFRGPSQPLGPSEREPHRARPQSNMVTRGGSRRRSFSPAAPQVCAFDDDDDGRGLHEARSHPRSGEGAPLRRRRYGRLRGRAQGSQPGADQAAGRFSGGRPDRSAPRSDTPKPHGRDPGPALRARGQAGRER
jgi:ATP-dependent Lhr-like helicase